MFRLPANYPHQFWILFVGLFINRVSVSLVWPFLTQHMHETLGIALTLTTLLITLQSMSGLFSTYVVSPMMDRVGRKGMMIFGLIASSSALLVMSITDTFAGWVLLMAVYGAVNQIFNIGSNAMVADLIEPDRRAKAYALVRMVSNLGIAIGPAIGGLLIAAFSFSITFYITAAVNMALAGVAIFTLAETIPHRATRAEQRADGGFRAVLRDRLFMSVCGLYILSLGGPSIIFSLMYVYIKGEYGIEASQFSWIVTTNALMVVLLQYSVTHITERFRPYPVMALGALLYAVGVGSVGFGTAFPAFLLSMVILTAGELLINPTVTALVANLAPVHMRARYMGVISIAYPVAAGFAPVVGGLLADLVSPQATWYGGMLMGLFAALGFYRLARRRLYEEPTFAPAASAD